jgi:hypothetical protein
MGLLSKAEDYRGFLLDRSYNTSCSGTERGVVGDIGRARGATATPQVRALRRGEACARALVAVSLRSRPNEVPLRCEATLSCGYA